MKGFLPKQEVFNDTTQLYLLRKQVDFVCMLRNSYRRTFTHFVSRRLLNGCFHTGLLDINVQGINWYPYIPDKGRTSNKRTHIYFAGGK